jgi:soluble P-type ATPase
MVCGKTYLQVKTLRSILLSFTNFLYNCAMIELNIPGRGIIQLNHLVCDVNGTLATDGQLHEGLPRLLHMLQDRLRLHLLTADTHGKQTIIDQQLNLKAVRIQPGKEAEQKADYIRQLNANQCAAIGQGANDAAMLKTAAVGIGILSTEGIAGETLLAADILVPDIFAALALFENPLRMVATLRR